MSVFYGSDSNCLTDVGLFDLQITDPIILIGQRVYRRLSTPRGGLASIGDDQSFGWDVRQYVLGRLSPTDVDQAQRQITAEVLKDEQVQSAVVKLTFVSGGTLTIQIDMISSVGPFTMTLNVNQLTATPVFNF